MAGRKGSLTGRCQGCNHPERVRIERFLAAGAGHDLESPLSACLFSPKTLTKIPGLKRNRTGH